MRLETGSPCPPFWLSLPWRQAGSGEQTGPPWHGQELSSSQVGTVSS